MSMALDWTIPPALIWLGVVFLVAVAVAALVVEVRDIMGTHPEFVARHTPHWFDDPE